MPPLGLMPVEKAQLIWEQWRYRHGFFWEGFYTVTVTTAIVSTVPLLKTDIIDRLVWFSVAFPLFGLTLGLFGRTLLEAEYKRLGAVGDAFDTSPWNYGARRTPPYRTYVGKPVGQLLKPISWAALVGVPIASLLVNILVLLT